MSKNVRYVLPIDPLSEFRTSDSLNFDPIDYAAAAQLSRACLTEVML